MIQLIFFSVLGMTLIAGSFSYFTPPQKPMDPIKFMKESTGLNDVEERNRKNSEQFNMTTTKGIVKMRQQTEEIAQEQNLLLDRIRDEQFILNNSTRAADEIMLSAKRAGHANNDDVLRLKALTAQMQDQQHLLVAHGRDILASSEQLTKSRQWVAEQIDMANVNTENSLNALQDHYAMFQDQATGFFNKVADYNQEVGDRMEQIQTHLKDMSNFAGHSSELQQNARDQIQRMLDREHEEMEMIADMQERNRDSLRDARERVADSQEQLRDKLQQNQDMLDEENRKAQEQQEMIQQRIQDQEQRIQDQQNR